MVPRTQPLTSLFVFSTFLLACEARNSSVSSSTPPAKSDPATGYFACDAPEQDGWERCEEDRILWCHAEAHGDYGEPHFHSGINCATDGQRCAVIDVPNHVAACVSREPCLPGPWSCESGSIVACYEGFRATKRCGTGAVCATRNGRAECVRRGAGGQTGAGGAGGGGRDCVEELSSEVFEHACFHVEFGPFESVTGQAPNDYEESIAQTHVAYGIQLDSPNLTSFGVRFAKSGVYAFLLDHEANPTMRGPEGQLAPRAETASASCGGLPIAVLYDLEGGAPYRLALSTSRRTAQLVVERVAVDALRTVCSPSSAGGGSSGSNGGAHSGGHSAVGGAGFGGSAGAAAPPSGEAGAAGNAGAGGAGSSVACVPLKGGCSAAGDCCSGRCYARQCVVGECRTDGPCERDDECCLYCHQTEEAHCH
jgi:hypothetical protein